MSDPRTIRRLCVFCGSSSGTNPAVAAATDRLGLLLAERDIELVYGGGAVGLMGRIADVVVAAGGRARGVIPTGLFSSEVAHRGLTELIEVDSMHERKAIMYELSDAFIALPGGLGTLEELAETLTWRQIGIHDKPLGLLDVDGYYQPLVEWFDRAASDGLLKANNRSLVHVGSDPVELLGTLAADAQPYEPKWDG